MAYTHKSPEFPQLTPMPSVKPLSSVLVKPAGSDCNLACGYCFYLEKCERLYPGEKKHRMSLEVLDEMVKQVMQNGGWQVNFGWQGGEPTLMGIDFFEHAVAFQKKYGHDGQTVGNGMQTNGYLIDRDWADFLGSHDFLVGLSLDGPQHIHDHYRLDRGGQPTWERVIKSARLLISRQVAVNALTVVNAYSWQYPEEIYDFHKSEGLRYMQFIPCVETDPNDPTRKAPFSVEPEQYGEFLCKVFDKWIKDFKNTRPTTSVRHFDSLIHSYLGMPAPECTLAPECGSYVCIEHTGDVYSCDFFVEPEWKLGNVLQGDLLEMLNSPLQKKFGMEKQNLPQKCRDCKWLPVCWGGCPKDRVRNPRTGGFCHFCRSQEMFMEHAHTRLKRLAERVRREQEAYQQGQPESPGSPKKKKNKKKR